jgi:long-chain acyl-CoA synthetase
MYIDFILEVFEKHKQNDALICKDKAYKYSELRERYDFWIDFLRRNISSGAVVGVKAEYSADSVMLMLALIENSNIFVPFSYENKDIEEKISIANVEYMFHFIDSEFEFSKTGKTATHELVDVLRKRNRPGVIIFTSGSTGIPKAAIHDFTFLLNKFKSPGKTLRSITFLLFDHWGGINTLLGIFSNGGVVGVPVNRSPQSVCEFIEKFEIELLPATPTFLKLILLSKSYVKHDLSSLKIVSYGTEAMPEATLKAFNKQFPYIKLKQTYGLTELGVMRTKSKSSDSLWLKVGGDDYKTKISDGRLFIKAKSAILGYLNAPSPFDEEGWYDTGDRVELNGEWIRFLGRDSDVINVGGQKVYPAEVESVLLDMDNILDVAVKGVDNPIMGQVVQASFVTSENESVSDLKKRTRKYCRGLMENYKVPVHVKIVSGIEYSSRFKKIR